MKSRLSLLVGATALALAASTLAAPAPAAAGTPGAPAAAGGAPAGSPVTVTLITGDRVTVTPGGGYHVERGAGRTGISFAIDEQEGRLRVVPSDAASLVRRGRLDPRLFDVTRLIEYGYDDRRGDLPLIVTGSRQGLASGLRQSMTAGGAQVTRELSAVRGLAVRVRKQDVTGFWNRVRDGARTLSGGKESSGDPDGIWLDGLRKPALDTSVTQIGAPAAWQRGHTGAGVKVAVLDTGVDAAHPDLAGRVAAQADFTGSGDPTDHDGHGTHIASTIAGSGAASGGTYKGVAPGVSLLAGKVCVISCADSAVLAGLQWAAEQGAKVVNLSLGGEDTPELDPLESAVETLTERYGMLFVVSAGNSGRQRSVESPASADAALAVGAVTKSGDLAEFSSRGPRAYDSALKPEITAPGEDIVAARSKDARDGEGSYVSMSGTSMAAPHVAGAAAILAGQHPDWSPAMLKAALMGSASPNPTLGVFDQGAGRVDVDRATAQAVIAEPGGVGFGVQEWPHDDDKPLTRQVTYRNHGTAPVTLALSVEGGSGAFTVSPATVTVPAGGRAEVSVTADTKAAPVGFLGGHLVAAGGDVRVSTPLAVEIEQEAYALTFEHTGRDGAPATDHLTTLHRIDPSGLVQEITLPDSGDGRGTLRLPKGRYVIRSTLFEGDHATQLVHPGLDLTENRTLHLDARLGKPITVGVPDASAAPVSAQVTFSDGRVVYPLVSERFENLATAQLGPERSYDESRTQISGMWARPAGSRVYQLAWFHEGGMVTGFRRQVSERDLATVRTAYAAHVTGGQGRAAVAPQPPDGPISELLTEITFPMPSTITEYVNADGGVTWRRSFWEDGPEGRATSLESGPARYAPGRTYQESWNTGVFSPVLAAGEEGYGVTRSGDAIAANPSLYGDGAGHPGWSVITRARVALYRDGVLIGESAQPGRIGFRVPPEDAGYRLVVETERGAPATLTTRNAVTWTFRSGHTEAATPLPVSVVRFAPALDAANTAPSGRTYRIPIRVERQPGSAAGDVRELSVEVSFDDGATWSPARVHRGQVTVHHPAAAGFVSLRARATDSAGNAVEQTVIRAYRITPRT
ncbi:S8 family serine peptidase [Nonomuraea sp. NPDC049309]|uniref:S8 family serine peptidase n=1 Tax=Nonomuraea sp. NPDC049309 TaxID=3364350 RepID=UPI00371DE107